MAGSINERARRLRTEAFALYLAAGHPGTPWYAKASITAVVAYVLSPIDLIPDFIPLLGYLDDIVLVSLCITLARRMVPEAVLNECRQQAHQTAARVTAGGRVAAVVIVAIWSATAALCAYWAYERFGR